MADMLELKAGLNVLEIGTGCGYSAALTAHLIKPGKLTTVEIVPELAEMGKRHLEHHFGALEGKIQVVEGDGSAGFKENAPYDRIYLTAAPDIRTLSQLATSGILLFPETTTHALYLYKKTKTGTKIEPFFGVAFVPLKGENC
jgi:protein-L-isoaspartate(D-aspartate) O-methyltransferase